MVGLLAETSVTQQLTKMNVKQSHLLLICKGWSFIKQNNLWLLLKMAKLFYQVKEENFSAKISNWEHSRYCEKIQTILFSMLHSQHWYRKFDLFYFWDICVLYLLSGIDYVIGLTKSNWLICIDCSFSLQIFSQRCQKNLKLGLYKNLKLL